MQQEEHGIWRDLESEDLGLSSYSTIYCCATMGIRGWGRDGGSSASFHL